MSNIAMNRKIKADRVYKTIGVVTPLRVAAGAVLLLFIFIFSGSPAEMLTNTGHYSSAEKLVLFDGWMEEYRHDTFEYIKAGTLYGEGDYEGAYDIVRGIDVTELRRGRMYYFADFCTGLGDELAAAGNPDAAEEMYAFSDAAIEYMENGHEKES